MTVDTFGSFSDSFRVATTVLIQPEPLRWARKLRFLSLEEAADRIGVEAAELSRWEATGAELSLTRFENVASSLRIPASVLFSPSAPSAPSLPEDFRTFLGVPPKHSFDFSVAFSRATDKARNLLSLLERTGEELPKLPLYGQTIDPESLAIKERERLGLDPLASLSWSPGRSFHHCRAIIEDAGVPIFQERFPEEDCRGFTFYYEGLGPVIVVNRNETFGAAKAFTVLHEYCHALRREYSLSDESPRNPREAYCNKFAAAFLMPRKLIQNLFGPVPNQPNSEIRSRIKYAAGRMKVSQQALAIRLEEIGYAPSGFAREFSRYQGFMPSRARKGGNATNTLFSDIGGKFASVAAEASNEGLVSLRELSELFGERVASIDAVITAAERQERYSKSR